MRLNFNCRERKVWLILIFAGYLFPAFAQIPNGAKETFHFKIEQENRLSFRSYQQIGLSSNLGVNNNYSSSTTPLSNGALLELAYRQVTIGFSVLNDSKQTDETQTTDMDLGYEYNLTKSLKLQPFIGYEINKVGSGITSGAKLNKNIDLFDYISLGLFAGLRYSRINGTQSERYANYKTSEENLSISLGFYFLIYSYKRPEIRKDW